MREESLATGVAVASSSILNEQPTPCAACNQPPESGKKLLGCTRCKKVFYHDKNCQKQDYHSHKKVCRQLAASFVGIDVADSASDLGRVAIAINDFAAGEIVLAEVPAIVFDHEHGGVELFTEFLNAPPHIQDSILDMHHSLDHQLGCGNESDTDIRHEIQCLQHEKKNLITIEVAHKLVSVVYQNAHKYVHEDKATNEPKVKGALYVLASKVEHSCVPNVAMNTNKLGMLEYHAITPIQRGARITFSYMEKEVYLSPRKERRKFLWETKNFLCQCKRCLGLDECNPFKCPECSEHTMFEGGGDGNYSEGIHYCLLCDKEVSSTSEIIRSQVQKHASFDSRLESLEARLENDDVDLANLASESLKLQSDIVSHCKSPLHWLHPSAWGLFSSVFSSYAQMKMQQSRSPSAIASYVRMSGYALLQEVKWTQQINAIAHGWEKLKDNASESNSAIKLKSIPSVSDVKKIINGLIEGTSTTMYSPTPTTTYKILQAGLNLLLEGDLGGDVAKLFERFYDELRRCSGLGKKERIMIKTLIDSKGRINDFPNHLV